MPEHLHATSDRATAEPPAKRSNYEMPNKKNTSLRNIVWALGLTMAVVVAVGIGFFGVGSDLEREVPEESQLDVAESAQRAQENVSFPVAVPQLGPQWQENLARYGGGDSPSWEVRYSAPSRELVTMVEGSEVGAAQISAAVPGAVIEQERVIGGADCQVLTTGDSGDQRRGIACEGEDWGILVHGTGTADEIEELATAAIDAIAAAA